MKYRQTLLASMFSAIASSRWCSISLRRYLIAVGILLVGVSEGHTSPITIAEWTFGEETTSGLPAYWSYGSYRDIAPDIGGDLGNLRATSAYGGSPSSGGASTFNSGGGNSNLRAPDDGTGSIYQVLGDNAYGGGVLITLDTRGFSDLLFSFDRTANPNNPWTLQVSGDGVNYSTHLFGPTGNALHWFHGEVDLSAYDGLEDNPNAYFLLSSRSDVAAIDNINISGTSQSVPDGGATIALLSMGLTALFGIYKIRRPMTV
jgi:hypothetical protein